MHSTEHAPSTSSAFVSAPDAVPGPRDLAGLQRDVFAVMRRSPAVFVLLPALAFLPFDFLNELLSSAIGGDNDLAALKAYNRFGQWIELGVGSVVAATVLQALVMVGEGGTPTIGSALRAGHEAWGRSLKTTFITGLFVGLGTLLFIIPGVVMATRYMLAVPAAVLDGHDSAAARARSAELVASRGGFRLFLWAFAGLFSWYVLSMLPTMTASLLMPTLPSVAGAAVNAVLAACWNIVGAGLVVAAGLLYLELSGRTLVWPVGLSLRTTDGRAVVGPRGTGHGALVAVGVVAGLSAMVLVPLMAVGLWFLFDAEGAEQTISQSPAVQSALNSVFQLGGAADVEVLDGPFPIADEPGGDVDSAGADSAGLDSPPATATGNTGADGEGDNAAPTP